MKKSLKTGAVLVSPSGKVSSQNGGQNDWQFLTRLVCAKMHNFLRRGRLWIDFGRLFCSASLSLLLMLRGQGLELAWLSEASLDSTAAWPRPLQGHSGRSSCRIKGLSSPPAAAPPASRPLMLRLQKISFGRLVQGMI